MSTEEAARRWRAREAARRYRARQSGLAVPKLKAGRPRKDEPPSESSVCARDWEELLKEGSTVTFVGSQFGYNNWMLMDSKTGVFKLLTVPDGPETYAAIMKIFSSPVGLHMVLGRPEERMATLIQETIDALPPLEPVVALMELRLGDPRLTRARLVSMREIYRYGGLPSQKGEEDQRGEAAPGADKASDPVDDHHNHGGDDDAQS